MLYVLLLLHLLLLLLLLLHQQHDVSQKERGSASAVWHLLRSPRLRSYDASIVERS
jgi:hypothetical protein